MNQSAFRAALLDPDRPVPRGVTDPEGRPAGCRFDVYRNNVTASLTEALRQAFPVIRKLVGEEFFTAMAIAHARAHPPRSPVMMFYGADMPGFLAAFPPVAHLGYLPDIARLELALREAYHAADTAPVAADRLAALPGAEFLSARISFAPALRIVQSRWPVHAIWSANVAGTPMPRDRRAEDVVILRAGFDPVPQVLPDHAAGFLTLLQAGHPLGQALAATPDFDLTATLGILLSGAAITDIALESAPC